MEWYYIVLIVLGSLIVLISLLFPFILSYLLYSIHMVRTSKNKWGRECSSKKNEEQMKMWDEGLKYIEPYKDRIVEVEIENDGLKLVGEYVNNNADRCVLIMGGRCESLYYAYYYAKPYLENNCNVLVIDSRAHGNSEGKINTVGFNESRDVLKWVELLHDKFNNKEIYLHGTCIGAATGIHALANKNCPSYVTKIITDGVYDTYYEAFKGHMIDLNKPVWPALDLTFAWYKFFGKIDAKNNGPITLIDKINPNVEILMISGLKDKFVKPEVTKKLFNLCSCKNKRYHYLSEGGHSHLRVNQVEEYDRLVIEFIGKK